MPSIQENLIQTEQSQNEVLSSGPDFFEDQISEIRQATKSILVKAFLWRNDETGQAFAQALLEAAEKGIQVLVIKDRIGAFYEYSEGNGQSFFHDYLDHHSCHRLSTVHPQAKLMALFNKNEQKKLQKNPHRQAFVEHPNIQVIDQYKLYDHSKVLCIDGRVSYVGGIGIGNEFAHIGDVKYQDSAVKITDPDATQDLMHILAGIPTHGQNKHSTNFVTGPECHETALKFITDTREELWIEMAFLGNRDYIRAIRDLVCAGKKIKLIMPENSTSHHYRNLHFLKTLRRLIVKAKGDLNNLQVFLLPDMLHGKSMLRDFKEVWNGSHNFSMNKNTVEETNFVTDEEHIVEQIQKQFSDAMGSAKEDINSPPWRKIILKSRLEWAGVMLQSLARKSRDQAVTQARTECQNAIRELILA
ncbi:MAG: phosphatidylserine/phosphatidylglycerophosphate/cardiolipin synthase family protein [Candidatus Gracilibacteria bacterium]|nr:phosphatidylserine/phosphatidylglycerophosphate/cardiolipin synthase family protein [Candidatus Gracilibacteria bacterium]